MIGGLIKHARIYGEKGNLWLKIIPEIIKEYEIKWLFKAFPPFKNLTYNYVTPVKCNDGKNAVLKIGFPDDKEFQSEIEALILFNGEGITKLLKVDKEKSVILIEQISPGISLSTIKDDEQATRIITSIMKKIWKPLPQKNPFITIFQWTKALYEYPDRYKNNNPPIPFNLVEKAKKLFEELINTSLSPVLTHADLHHDNILSSDRGGWKAIDPKGIIAEPVYETAAMIRNPYKKISVMENIEGLLKKRIEIISEELNFNPKRIHKWCLAQTILSGVWTSEDKGYTKHALKVARALENICF